MAILATIFIGGCLFLGWIGGHPAVAAIMALIFGVCGALIGGISADHSLLSKELFGLGFGFCVGVAIGLGPFLLWGRKQVSPPVWRP